MRRLPRIAPVMLLGVVALGTIARGSQLETVAVQLLAFNDFHGHLEPPSGSNGRIADVDAGGAEYLSAHLKLLAERNPNTLVIASGDLVGASPLLSAMFHDEPAVHALNLMNVGVSSVGNHEFDSGWQELLRLQNGGCRPGGCGGDFPFPGAAYQYLAANVLFEPATTGRTGPVLPAYTIKELGGVPIGFIGITLRATPQLVLPTAVEGLTFESEEATANRWTAVLKRQGVRAIVVLIHEGGVPIGENYNGCAGISGPILNIAKRISKDVDVIVSGHTHRAYNCMIDRKLVTSAAAFGRLITAIDLTLDKRTNDVISKGARNVVVTRTVPRDPAQTAIIERYRPFYATVAERVIGTLIGDLTRTTNSAGESVLGDTIADATLEMANAAGRADVAFMNPGGIRSDLIHGLANLAEPRPITYAEAASVLPFRNRVVVMTLTGGMIKDILEQQFDNVGPGQDRILQVSRGFSYAYDRRSPKSRRVDPRSMALDGRPVRADQRYRVALNEFLAAGGDNFSGFTRGTDVETVGLDLEMLTAYFAKHSPVPPVPTDRIRRVR